MRDPERITKMLEFLRTVWKRSPDLRLGQLILNASKGSNHEDEFTDLYNVEDEDLLERLEKIYFKFPQ